MIRHSTFVVSVVDLKASFLLTELAIVRLPGRGADIFSFERIDDDDGALPKELNLCI